MTRTIMRWTMTGALALAAAGAVGGVVPGAATAEAAPRSAGPFAGRYVGRVPNVGSIVPWNITTSDSGAVNGSYSSHFKGWRDPRGEYDIPASWHSGEFAGTVDAGGRLEISGTQTVRVTGSPASTTTFASSATAVPQANGDLVVTDAATGTSEVWTRR
jgi:hypothetical protein